MAARKLPFDIDKVMSLLKKAAKPFPQAMLFQLRDDGYTSVFHILVACILSIRTFEETSYPTSKSLFEKAPTPQAVLDLGPRALLALIRPVTFPEPKARDILAIARATVTDHHGQLPCDPEILQQFRGVGPKCAALAIGIACGTPPGIPVDSHVHTLTNRWGYVHAKTPNTTARQLQAKLPQKYWLPLNQYAVPFGKNICTPLSPKCSICPLLPYCQQIGVTRHR